ncbi:hypothetical protein [Nocardia brasiliensis]|uniref:hypothetical protein n=1 Tax=Nocardia brasiliensis TaxID=37326 RepID=UPI003D8E293A
MTDPSLAVLPVALWLALYAATKLSGGTDLDYRRRELRFARPPGSVPHSVMVTNSSTE